LSEFGVRFPPVWWGIQEAVIMLKLCTKYINAHIGIGIVSVLIGTDDEFHRPLFV
jgi:hypothetical protein